MKQISSTHVEHGQEHGSDYSQQKEMPTGTTTMNMSAAATDAGEARTRRGREKAEDDNLHSLNVAYDSSSTTAPDHGARSAELNVGPPYRGGVGVRKRPVGCNNH